jgi:hypothetical protein
MKTIFEIVSCYYYNDINNTLEELKIRDIELNIIIKGTSNINLIKDFLRLPKVTQFSHKTSDHHSCLNISRILLQLLLGNFHHLLQIIPLFFRLLSKSNRYFIIDEPNHKLSINIIKFVFILYFL